MMMWLFSTEKRDCSFEDDDENLHEQQLTYRVLCPLLELTFLPFDCLCRTILKRGRTQLSIDT